MPASPTSSHLFDLGTASKAAFVSTNDGLSTAQEFISNTHYYVIHSYCAEFFKKRKERVRQYPREAPVQGWYRLLIEFLI